jgi:N-terminal domain on NACHT_NTPase and P-loop NTPases
MLDPLTAIGLAGNIITFIDFSYELFMSTKKIYSSASETHSGSNSLETLSSNLRDIAKKLQTPIAPPPQGQQLPSDDLQNLARNCYKAAAELLEVLEKLAPKNKSIWNSFLSALKTEWRKERIDEMGRRLDSFRLQMILQLQVLKG